MAYKNLTGKPDEVVTLRHDERFPMMHFARKYPGVWHVMMTRSTSRCGRFIVTDVGIGIDTMERGSLCNQCVVKGMEYGNVRVHEVK